MSLLNYIFKSIFKVKRFLGQAYTMTTCCFPYLKKKEKNVVVTLADHVLSVLYTIMLFLILSSVLV